MWIGGVVEQYEHPPVVEQRTVQCAFRLDRRGHPGRGHPKRGEEVVQDAFWIGRRAGSVAAQVGVEVAVRVPVRDAVRPMDRQRRLADSGGSVHGGDRHDQVGVSAVDIGAACEGRCRPAVVFLGRIPQLSKGLRGARSATGP